jgi:demethylmenaquinone methyltransferase/2-methoxy-6-polyprenyl-1,4-benzoquinol methylase
MTQTKPLHGMFTDVPPRYDLVNHVITWYLDTGWRRLAAATCLAGKPSRVLDLCCGTGDLALDLAGMAGKATKITGLDYSQPMLEIAAAKAKAAGLNKKVVFIEGDAAAMPFPDGHFDCVGISFAFRNLTYKNPHTAAYLAEVLRVLAPGGRFVIVETSQPPSRFIRWCYHLYLRAFVAPVGQLLSGNRGAYHYLAESARRFCNPRQAEELLLGAGFAAFEHRPLLLGATAIYVAVK